MMMHPTSRSAPALTLSPWTHFAVRPLPFLALAAGTSDWAESPPLMNYIHNYGLDRGFNAGHIYEGGIFWQPWEGLGRQASPSIVIPPTSTSRGVSQSERRAGSSEIIEPAESAVEPPPPPPSAFP